MRVSVDPDRITLDDGFQMFCHPSVGETRNGTSRLEHSLFGSNPLAEEIWGGLNSESQYASRPSARGVSRTWGTSMCDVFETDHGYCQQKELDVTGVTLSSGLDVRHNSRSSSQQAQAGIQSKYDRSDNPADRIRWERLVVKPLSAKLDCNNAICLILLEDVAKHDIAKECQQWQVGLLACWSRTTCRHHF